MQEEKSRDLTAGQPINDMKYIRAVNRDPATNTLIILYRQISVAENTQPVHGLIARVICGKDIVAELIVKSNSLNSIG
jgi:hypothetical protein